MPCVPHLISPPHWIPSCASHRRQEPGRQLPTAAQEPACTGISICEGKNLHIKVPTSPPQRQTLFRIGEICNFRNAVPDGHCMFCYAHRMQVSYWKRKKKISFLAGSHNFRIARFGFHLDMTQAAFAVSKESQSRNVINSPDITF
jgi:hypothetical protein